MRLIIQKLVLVIACSVVPVFIVLAQGQAYWQDYDQESLLKRIKDPNVNSSTVDYALPNKPSQLYFIAKNFDPAEIKLLETLLLSDKRLLVHKVKMKLIGEPVMMLTMPVGINAAVLNNQEAILELKQALVDEDKNLGLNYFLNITEFLVNLNTQSKAIFYLLTIDDGMEQHHFVSKGLTINQNFYTKYLYNSKFGLEKCYSILPVLSELYATQGRDWQLALTANKLTKLEHLLTILMK